MLTVFRASNSDLSTISIDFGGGHVETSVARNSGPFHYMEHLISSSGSRPLDAISAGLFFDEMWLKYCDGYVMISEVRFPTKVLQRLGGAAIQDKTIIESVWQKMFTFRCENADLT